MRWRDMRESGNVEDRRGMGVGGYGVRLGGLGGGGLVILLLVSWLMTGSPLGLISDGADPGGGETGTRGAPADEAGQFASRILGDTEDTWRQLFGQMNRSYREPTLVLFSDAVASACGTGSSAVGPFYCPGDHKVYLDLTFYIELEQRFGAPGDFARAYVLAHEVGHHVQNQLGILGQRGGARSREEANALSVAQELQADCFAGVWGHYAATRRLLEPGDVDEGLNAAAAIGDDRIQRRTQGQVTPESWTHGSSEQRASWFRRGLESGQPSACDTSR